MKLLTISLTALAAFLIVARFVPFASESPPREIPAEFETPVEAVRGKTSVLFEKNAGQIHPDVRFTTRGVDRQVYLTDEGVFFRSVGMPPDGENAVSLDIQFLNTSGHFEGTVGNEPVRRTHYFLGKDPAEWITDVPNYDRLQLDNLYPGIDLEYYGNDGRLEFDFVVAPGAETKNIRFRLDGVPEITLDGKGNLVVADRDGDIILERPIAYQQIDGRRQVVATEFVVEGHEVRIRVGDYDPGHLLVIDPVVGFSTFLGANSADYAVDVGVDAAGYVYIVGNTYTPQFPTGDAAYYHPSENPSQDENVFVTKMTPAGNRILWTAFVGGHDHEGLEETAQAIAVDSEGNAYVTGKTFTYDFPTKNAIQSENNDPIADCYASVVADDCGDAFVFKLSSAGDDLLYSTYLGGDEPDYGSAIALDGGGNAYVLGHTESDQFLSESQTQFAETDFVVRINPDGGRGYATLLGDTHAPAIAADGQGRVYLAGWDEPAECTRFSTDLVRLSSNGAVTEVWARFCGFANARGISVGADGRLYVGGFVGATDDELPITSGAFQPQLGGGWDGFVSVWGTAGSLLYFSYLGGSDDDKLLDIAVDRRGVIHVTGSTDSQNFPTDPEGFQPVAPVAWQNALAASIDPSVSGSDGLVYSTYLGGAKQSIGEGVAVSVRGNAYHVGWTWADDFPVLNALQPDHKASVDAFVFMIGDPLQIVVNSELDGDDTNHDDKNCTTGDTIFRDDKEEPECTLRAAIQTSNAMLEEGIPILFDIPDEVGPPLIEVDWPLPWVTKSVLIDGTSQPGSQMVEIDGSGVPQGVEADGLHLNTSRVEIRALTLHSFNEYGVAIEGGVGHKITKSVIGFDPEGETLKPNGLGAIRVFDGAKDVTIGGWEEEEMNHLGGGLVIAGSETKGISVLKNEMALEDGAAKLLVDLSDASDSTPDGPTCQDWAHTDRTGPNGNLPAPRLLRVDGEYARGMTRPRARVILYELEETGSGLQRYYAKKIRPVGYTTADANGAFEIYTGMFDSTYVTAIAIDEDGNSSELSQVRRPIVYVPDIGGTWLKDGGGANAWPPFEVKSDSDEEVMERLLRLEMDERGKDIHGIRPHRVIELFLEKTFGNYTVVQILGLAGYPRYLENARPAEQDLWLFPYDWRKRPTETADSLRRFIDRVVGEDNDAAAWACQADILASGLGGIVAATYVKRNSEAREHIHRLFAFATPFKGAPAYFGFHLRSVLIGLAGRIRSFQPDRRRVIAMQRNWPVAYALLPPLSAYELVADRYPQTHGFLEKPVFGYFAPDWDVRAFFVRGKDAKPFGLGRNGFLAKENATLLSSFDDVWDGPPQLIAFQALKPWTQHVSTVWQWDIRNRELFELEAWEVESLLANSQYREGNEPAEIVWYRERLVPVLQDGDGIIPSWAMLPPKVSPGGPEEWVVADQVRCGHFVTYNNDCMTAGADRLFMDRLVRLLNSSYRVTTIEGWPTEPMTKSHANGDANVFYVQGSGPITVVVKDGHGNHTGPETPEDPFRFEYAVPEIGYWASTFGVTLSLPADSTYTVDVVAPVQETRVSIIRMVAGENNRENLLFDRQVLSQGGTVRFTLSEGGTPIDAAWEVDANGDGAYEGTLAPTAQLTSTGAAPAIPRPSPGVLAAGVIKAVQTVTTASIDLPDVGGPLWQWTLAKNADWIQPDATAGQTPASIDLTLDGAALSEGSYSDTLTLELSIQNYAITYPVVVDFTVSEQQAALTSIAVTPDFVVLEPGEIQTFTAEGFDQVGGVFPLTASWSATGGTIDASGVFTAGAFGGSFVVRAEDASGTVVGEAQVEIVGPVGAEESEPVPTEYALLQSYPNPFNPTATIEYAVPVQSSVRLMVYDLLGREVQRLVDGSRAPGHYRVGFDAGALPSGLYLYRMEADGFVETRTMLLTK